MPKRIWPGEKTMQCPLTFSNIERIDRASNQKTMAWNSIFSGIHSFFWLCRYLQLCSIKTLITPKTLSCNFKNDHTIREDLKFP